MACGNIGTPVLDAIRDPQGFDFLVVELSSFQLHYVGSIEPKVSALLNIAEDHIDWHKSFEAYVQAKGKIFNGTTGAIIYNAEDSQTRKLAEAALCLSEERFRAIWEESFDGMRLLDSSGTIVMVNDAFCKQILTDSFVG